MDIVQKTYLQIEKDGKLIQLVVDGDMPLGAIFDALMEFKSYAVQRMTSAHAEEQEEADRQMGCHEELETEKEGS